MRAIDRSIIGKSHRGKWGALKSDRRTVIASGRSVKAVMQAAAKKGHHDPIVTRIPRSPAVFVGTASALNSSVNCQRFLRDFVRNLSRFPFDIGWLSWNPPE